MKLNEVKETFKWLQNNFSNFDFYTEKELATEITAVEVCIYSEDEEMQRKRLFFDKEGNELTEYNKQYELRQQIKELQQKLEPLPTGLM